MDQCTSHLSSIDDFQSSALCLALIDGRWNKSLEIPSSSAQSEQYFSSHDKVDCMGHFVLCFRLDNLREIPSHKFVPEFLANNVVFSSVNNIPASRLIFDSVSSVPININGSIHFNNGLKTDAVLLTGGGKVNGIDIAQEVFIPTKAIPGERKSSREINTSRSGTCFRKL